MFHQTASAKSVKGSFLFFNSPPNIEPAAYENSRYQMQQPLRTSAVLCRQAFLLAMLGVSERFFVKG
jgi:hypothetical protein